MAWYGWHMTTADETAPSVRVELGDLGPGVDIAPIEPGKQSNGATGKRALAIAAVALLGIVGLIAALSPTPGSTAAGTPITTTTIPPDTTQAPASIDAEDVTDESVDGENGADDDGAESGLRDPIGLYESAESPFLVFNVVAADVGWFVHGYDNEAQDGALYRSLDGLNWDRLDLTSVTSGSVVGFERLGGTYVVAIDERNAWNDTNGADLETSGYEISFWESPDAANWVPAVGRPSANGQGFPYPVKFSETATLIPQIQSPGESSLPALVSYLSGVMDAETAQQVCGATTRLEPETLVETIIFRDCEGEVLIEVEGEEASALINAPGPGVSICVEELRAFSAQSYSLQYFGTDGSTEVVDLADRFALFGELVGETYLGSMPPNGGIVGPSSCGQERAESTEAGLVLWSPDSEIETVEVLDISPEVSFFGVAVNADNHAFLAGDSTVLRAVPPYTAWESLDIGDPAEEPEGGPRRISIAPDGSMFMATDGDEWFFARPGDTDWVQVEARSRDFGNVLLGGEDFAIVEVQRGENTLVKVPLS